MAGLCAPLSTLRRGPRGHLRMTRGRCGSLLLHRDGLAPSTPCRSPGALRFTPNSDNWADIQVGSYVPRRDTTGLRAHRLAQPHSLPPVATAATSRTRMLPINIPSANWTHTHSQLLSMWLFR